MKAKTSRERVLDPIDRASEIIFGLLMALSFTGSLSAATAGREEIRTVMFAAIACNIAWGLVDAVMYLVAVLTERARERKSVSGRNGAARVSLTREDYSGALGVFLLVTLATFPIVIPFFLFAETPTAMRVSNGVALLMLFAAGYQLGSHAGFSPWRSGFVMAGIGAALVAVIIALGG